MVLFDVISFIIKILISKRRSELRLFNDLKVRMLEIHRVEVNNEFRIVDIAADDSELLIDVQCGNDLIHAQYGHFDDVIIMQQPG